MEKVKRCAIYTRKSHEEGLDMEFNSLDAQREAALNYIASQKASGWVALPESYDDGGFSGGNMNRPALERLLDDIRAGKIDIVVVYKIDRLSRSLTDFASIQTEFEKHNVSFVSVTQEINTNTSAGRMMLNILMTFAQFEREIIAERIRDKLSSARKKGKYIGGVLPLGYRADSVAMKIEIEPDEARIVRQIFNTFVSTLSVKAVQRKLKCEGITRPVRTSRKGKEISGREISCTVIRKVLQNPIYIGKIRYRGQEYPGEHKGFIPEELFQRAQEGLAGMKRIVRAPSPEVENPFTGILYCGHCRRAMFRTKKSNEKRQYEYYVCSRDSKAAASECPVHRVTASCIDKAVQKAIQSLLLTPTMLAQICGRELVPDDARDELADIDEVWARMFPAERRKLARTLFKRVLIFPNEVKIIMSGAAAEKMLKEAGVEYMVEHDTGDLVMSIPCQMKQHNNRKVIALVDVKEEPGYRSQIQRALIQAEKGMERIISGKATTIGEIADRMNVDRSYVARTLALANLAPDIVKLIWEGRQPKGLTLEKLRHGIPDSWAEQRRVFGVV